MDSVISCLTDDHMELISLNSVVLNLLNSVSNCFPMFSKSVFFQRNIFLLVGLGLYAFVDMSTIKMSWSLFPIGGRVLHLSTCPGWLVNRRSNKSLLCLVGHHLSCELGRFCLISGSDL
jgi:hypothetical protein